MKRILKFFGFEFLTRKLIFIHDLIKFIDLDFVPSFPINIEIMNNLIIDMTKLITILLLL
jgi:hypothetical protein